MASIGGELSELVDLSGMDSVTTKTTSARLMSVLARWMSFHAPNTKIRIAQCVLEAETFVALRRACHVTGDGAALSPVWLVTLSVESSGSGIVLCRGLKVDVRTTTVGALKARIAAVCPTYKRWQLRLYCGQGGRALRNDRRPLAFYGVRDGDVVVPMRLLVEEERGGGAHEQQQQQQRTVFRLAVGKTEEKQRRKLKKRWKKRCSTEVRVSAAGLDKLREALESDDPSGVMEQLKLTPLSVPVWVEYHVSTMMFTTTVPLRPGLAHDSVLSYARAMRLLCLPMLEEWAKQLKQLLNAV